MCAVHVRPFFLLLAHLSVILYVSVLFLVIFFFRTHLSRCQEKEGIKKIKKF